MNFWREAFVPTPKRHTNKVDQLAQNIIFIKSFSRKKWKRNVKVVFDGTDTLSGIYGYFAWQRVFAKPGSNILIC